MKKKQIIIGSVSLILVLSIGVGIWLFNQPCTIDLNFNFEYGKPISITKEDLFTQEDLKRIKDFKIDLSDIKNEKDKEYPEVGNYECKVTYSKWFIPHTSSIQIQVEDTTKPKFSKFSDVVEIPLGSDQNYDFSSYFLAEDLSETSIQYKTEEVDFLNPGDYRMMIIASDTYGNSIEKECIVRVQYEKETSSPNKPAENEEDQSVVSSDPYYVQGIMVVNKKHGLPANYAPQENAEAGAKIRQLIADMQRQGYAISSSYSGYRSYSYQSSLYNNYVNSYGQAQADRFSARPGYSEHQTGLAFDLKHSNGTLVETTPEVNWIAAHAHEYGFIVRYPSGKESVTGYMPEPWHLRYVGDQASAIYASGLTLEEYLGISGGGY
ncbi:MAG: M15 family metallopeptidase [Faecalicoccus sp.]|uniref:M15 family metallopeptidase n=1 Tax=Faecalicoccus sp. TaxID=1971758 RepID=UPI002F925BBB